MARNELLELLYNSPGAEADEDGDIELKASSKIKFSPAAKVGVIGYGVYVFWKETRRP